MKIRLCQQLLCVGVTLYGIVMPVTAKDPSGVDLQGEAFQKLRDPFWPVGYKPVSESEKIEQGKIADLKAKISWPALPLRGVTHAGGKNYVAIIEGVGLVEAGDIVVIEQDSLIYRWRIDKVTGAGLSSTRLDVTDKTAAQK